MNNDIADTARYHLEALNTLATEFDQEQYERIANKLLDLYKLFGAMAEEKNEISVVFHSFFSRGGEE